MQPKDFKNHIVYLYYFNNHNRSWEVIVEIKYCNNLNVDTHSRDQIRQTETKSVFLNLCNTGNPFHGRMHSSSCWHVKNNFKLSITLFL